MRPIALPQPFLRNPLNALMNAEANVRLLRVMADADEPLSAQEAARRAELTEPGARRALQRLVASGFVRRSGGDRDQRFGLRHEDPLNEAIVSIFATERRRYEALLVALRLAIVNSSSPPRSAWISRLPVEPGEPLEIGALHRSREVAAFMQEIREKLLFIETSFDVTIEVTCHTRADLPAIDAQNITALVGPPPPGTAPPGDADSARTRGRDHESALYARGLAELLARRPSLVERALHQVDELLSGDPGEHGEDLREWQRVLSGYSIPRLQRFVASNSLRAMRLRRCSPFPAILTDTERTRLDKILESLDAAD